MCRSATGFCFDLAKSASRQPHALHLALTLQGMFYMYYLLCIFNSEDLLVTFVHIAWFSKAMGGVSQALGSISIQWLIYERHLSLLSAICLSLPPAKLFRALYCTHVGFSQRLVVSAYKVARSVRCTLIVYTISQGNLWYCRSQIHEGDCCFDLVHWV